MAQQQKNAQEQDINQLLKVRREKLADLQANGKNPFEIVKYDVTHHSQEIKDNFESLEGQTVNIAGRMMSKRVMGKASFCNVQDLQGGIQSYVARDSVGEEPYKDFKKMDIGDIVGIRGEVFKTKTGEISLHAAEVTLLSKSLQILPEKFHGLTNTDLRYRQRYVDLIMNAEVKDTFIKRSQIISAIRRYLGQEGFLEVETPMLVSNAGGAAARPFETHFNALDEDFKLRISLELYLKRLIVGGMERVYEIGRVFRNEGLDTRHNPEFTLMELYQAYTDYNGMMDLTENLYRFVAQEVLGTTTITYNGVEMDLGKPFERITMLDAVKKYAGVDFNEIHTLEEARAAAREHHVAFEERHKKGDILSLFFEEFAEEHLIQPTFVMDHPIEISPLTKKKPGNPEYVERFEFFMNGWELANAYSELNDPIDQRERFQAQEELLAQGDEEANHTDEDFLNALEIGMPPTGGIGFGIDRMVMLLTDSAAIRDVLLFPTMKSLDGVNKKNDVNNTASEAPEKNVKTESEKIDFSKVKVEPLFEEFVDFDTFSKSDFRAVKVKECVAVPKSKKLLQFTLDDGTGTDRTILSGIHSFYEPEELVGKTLIAITNLPPRAMMGIDSCVMLLSAIHEEEGEEKLHLLMVDDHIPAGAKLY
ncbi:lysine--tRNA ligase [Lactonifactor sp. BIOML-A3]|uniref:lysine--tRNA ligase n=1 Tax=unclassified Lactonifactor TaxID=2636670 RepID=UPI00130702C8|nr:lysine--tRNA ligase [Lactonifactor sp. BIOML-A5]MSA07012.1 lysine--tRNA ligase [Lactonifactor sp. BIOML-A4]MSA11651.1 lysine--tRNA ligase [Lactonifactor sp. BIOML-A3]MSA16244.1 lysine--tRNA ligase [Lactonifactor sp. BIOML-A2]MSA36848.1 lysine--tRNA ligase [Lactonifactor sp. BIOML-A1]MSB12698.1 lysine--tRNA ligase [Lactonifactor sp. BIOML-A6]MSB68062.1 lysine--tRNA ligase [Lactonifactor sp. BIOML-A7]